MLLLIDIGNSTITIGGCDGVNILFTSGCASELKKTADEYALTFQGILALKGYTAQDVEGGIISSVVPALRSVVQKAMEKLTGRTFLMVGSGIKTGLNIRMDSPAQLGSDLVVNAVAASARYPKPLVFFYLSTATTLSVIDRNGAYLGGMIMPGLQISMDALAAQAAQLADVSLCTPQRMIGRNTVECMQSGAVYGWASMLDGLIERIEQELGEPVTAVATGDFLDVVLPCCRRKLIADPDLPLEGLRILYQKNQNQGRRR